MAQHCTGLSSPSCPKQVSANTGLSSPKKHEAQSCSATGLSSPILRSLNCFCSIQVGAPKTHTLHIRTFPFCQGGHLQGAAMVLKPSANQPAFIAFRNRVFKGFAACKACKACDITVPHSDLAREDFFSNAASLVKDPWPTKR